QGEAVSAGPALSPFTATQIAAVSPRASPSRAGWIVQTPAASGRASSRMTFSTPARNRALLRVTTFKQSR
ncbi:MAG: hypothetical protein LBB77_12180, partial [Treponema sp.]|nr:hypothetical protein [Treponema sp.]